MPLEMPQPEDGPVGRRAGRLDELLGYHLRRASVFDLQGAVSALEPANTRPVPMSVLLSIIETPGISSAGNLPVRSACREQTSYRSWQSSRNGGFSCARWTSPISASQRLFPTRRGETAAAEWLALVSEHERSMLRRLTVEEQSELRRLLAKIWQEDGPKQG